MPDTADFVHRLCELVKRMQPKGGQDFPLLVVADPADLDGVEGIFFRPALSTRRINGEWAVVIEPREGEEMDVDPPPEGMVG